MREFADPISLPGLDIGLPHILCPMASHPRLSKAQSAVLAALAPGGILSVDSLVRTTNASGSRTRRALLRLEAAGLVVHTGMVGRSGYQITVSGRRVLASDTGDSSRGRVTIAQHDIW
ncbi:hypothetical protein HGB38_24900 [Nocardia gamkensis]|uniref:DprA winged helix domain-containing protein n=2 Tax=Nocardia gamkensis TaxID=352869 RepID=A0A7X6L7R7_9NOCA|nr:hypothetical protein [Nocardia gamkensis]